MSAVVTRFAPSPTGFMHIGGVRTALYAYLWAQKNNGTFILRIEDTDKEREVAGSIDHIQEVLQWLNLTWDFGPDKPGPFGSCIQSQRLDTYKEFALQLIEKGYAYPDPYTQEEVEAFRQQAQEQKKPFLFRNHRPTTTEAWDGTKPLRFKVPEIKKYHWHDEARGDLEAGEEALDDFILIKSDGYPTYNFAHIIDDHYMGVTHIFRSDEFISSMPRFLSLYDALGFTPPVFVTLPPILREDRTKKLGKRDGAKDTLEYRNEGYLPDAMINFLALIGWNPGTDQEVFTPAELIESFDIHRIQKAGAIANEEKLDWLNREHIKKLDMAQFWTHAHVWLPKREWLTDTEPVREMLKKIEHLIRDRINKFSDVQTLFEAGEFDYFFTDPVVSPEMLRWKDDTLEHARQHLEKVKELLTDISESDWNHDQLKAVLMPYAEQEGKGNVLWPLRVALSGREKSPDPFELAGILGKAATLARITAVAE